VENLSNHALRSTGRATLVKKMYRLFLRGTLQLLERVMKVTYDPDVDVLRIVFSSAPIEESDEDKPGVILDYDADGNIVGLEILDASGRVEDPKSVEYVVAE